MEVNGEKTMVAAHAHGLRLDVMSKQPAHEFNGIREIRYSEIRYRDLPTLRRSA